MTRRRLPIALVVLGAVILLASIIAATVMRASDTVTLSLGERPEVPVVITEPGVLDAVDPTVRVRATADDDEPVVLAVGRTSEVEAWLGDGDHVRVSGLSSWEDLTAETVLGPEREPTEAPTEDGTGEADAEEPAPGSVPDPAGSDLWVVETSSTGTAEITWADSPGRWSLVAATDGTGPAPVVELEWGREVSTPWLVPGILLGAGLLVAGAVMLVLRVLAEREQRRRDEALARRQRGDELTDTGSVLVSITDTDPGTGERLSRRQIREMERAMAQADRRRRAGEEVPPPIPFTGPGEVRPGAAVAPDAEGADRSPAADAAEGADRSPAQDTAEDVDHGHGSDPAEDVADGSGPDAAAGAHDEPAPAAGPHDGPAPAAGPHDKPDPGEDRAAVDGEPDDDPSAPSWRAVWGFADTTTLPTDPDGEERR